MRGGFRRKNMTRMAIYLAAVLSVLALASFAGPVPMPPAAAAWQVKAAPLRVAVTVSDAPSEPVRGVLALLPDGGLFPGKFVIADVCDSAGHPLESQLVWHNPGEGAGVVFAPPGDGRAWIYLRPSDGPPPQAPGTLRPGLFLYTRNCAKPSLAAAAALAAAWPPGRDATMQPVTKIGHRENPMGPDDNYVSWYTGWFRLEKPTLGRFATVSDDGSEIRIDNQPIVSWPGMHGREEGARGQHAAEITVGAGWHQLDYHHFNVDGDREMQALLLWNPQDKPPKTLPVTITREMLGYSGRAAVDRIEFQDARPVARLRGNTQAISYFWFGEVPLVLFKLEAVADGNPAGTTYRWELGGNCRFTGEVCSWLQAGEAGGAVTLVAMANGKSSRCTLPLTTWRSPPEASIWNMESCAPFIQTLQAMAGAATERGEPCDTWGLAHWETLLSLPDPAKSEEVMKTVFIRNPGVVQRLAPSIRDTLQDRLLGVLCRQPGPAAALEWIGRFEVMKPEPPRRFDGQGRRTWAQIEAELAENAKNPQFHWQERRAWVQLWQDTDLEVARRSALRLRELAVSPDEVLLAVIRQGDVERMAGKFAVAQQFYAAAEELAKPPPRKATAKARKRFRRAAEADADEDTVWKTRVIRQASYPANLRKLLNEKQLDEAGKKFAEWAGEFPLDKLGDDEPLLEASWLDAEGNPAAALRLLEALRSRGAFSRSFPDLLAAELGLFQKMGRNEDVKRIAAELVAQFPNHPAAADARRFLPPEKKGGKP